VFKVVKDSLGGTLVPLIAALVLIGLGIAFAHAAPGLGGTALTPAWLQGQGPLGLPPLL
jgi:hypothetical protein